MASEVRGQVIDSNMMEARRFYGEMEKSACRTRKESSWGG